MAHPLNFICPKCSVTWDSGNVMVVTCPCRDDRRQAKAGKKRPVKRLKWRKR